MRTELKYGRYPDREVPLWTTVNVSVSDLVSLWFWFSYSCNWLLTTTYQTPRKYEMYPVICVAMTIENHQATSVKIQGIMSSVCVCVGGW